MSEYKLTPLTEDEINDLKRHSQMLNQIASYVSDFCDDGSTTTLETVMYLKAYWHRNEARKIEEYLYGEK
jgi:hypothetical protein